MKTISINVQPARLGVEDHPKNSQCRQAGNEHPNGADNEIGAILHLGFDKLRFDDPVKSEILT